MIDDNTETRRIWDESLGERVRPCAPQSGEVPQLPIAPPDRNFCYLTAAVFGAAALFCVAVAILLWALSKG